MQRACHKLSFALLTVCLVAVGASGGNVWAQDSSGGPLSKLTVHGYLTQAYATAEFADGGRTPRHADEQSLGIPEDGTFDYRNMAIQFRYEISPKDIMVIQFSSRGLGDSPGETAEDEVQLDWAFFEHRLGDNSGIKVGRVQIPYGLWNEVRDVGTILPFYRPSFLIYREGSLTSETVDGALLYHTFGADSAWRLEADFYFGEWGLVETEPLEGETATIARAEDAVGFQFWLNTPVDGLRFGLGGHQENVTAGQPLFRGPGDQTRRKWAIFSAELLRERWVLRFEDSYLDDSGVTGILAPFKATHLALQLGFNITEKFRIFLQGERGNGDIPGSGFSLPFPVLADINFDFRRDYGISFNYTFSPNVVLKIEHHITEFEQFDFELLFDGPVPIGFRPFTFFTDEGSYSIVSLSAAF